MGYLDDIIEGAVKGVVKAVKGKGDDVVKAVKGKADDVVRAIPAPPKVIPSATPAAAVKNALETTKTLPMGPPKTAKELRAEISANKSAAISAERQGKVHKTSSRRKAFNKEEHRVNTPDEAIGRFGSRNNQSIAAAEAMSSDIGKTLGILDNYASQNFRDTQAEALADAQKAARHWRNLTPAQRLAVADSKTGKKYDKIIQNIETGSTSSKKPEAAARAALGEGGLRGFVGDAGRTDLGIGVYRKGPKKGQPLENPFAGRQEFIDQGLSKRKMQDNLRDRREGVTPRWLVEKDLTQSAKSVERLLTEIAQSKDKGLETAINKMRAEDYADGTGYDDPDFFSDVRQLIDDRKAKVVKVGDERPVQGPYEPVKEPVDPNKASTTKSRSRAEADFDSKPARSNEFVVPDARPAKVLTKAEQREATREIQRTTKLARESRALNIKTNTKGKFGDKAFKAQDKAIRKAQAQKIADARKFKQGMTVTKLDRVEKAAPTARELRMERRNVGILRGEKRANTLGGGAKTTRAVKPDPVAPREFGNIYSERKEVLGDAAERKLAADGRAEVLRKSGDQKITDALVRLLAARRGRTTTARDKFVRGANGRFEAATGTGKKTGYRLPPEERQAYEARQAANNKKTDALRKAANKKKK